MGKEQRRDKRRDKLPFNGGINYYLTRLNGFLCRLPKGDDVDFDVTAAFTGLKHKAPNLMKSDTFMISFVNKIDPCFLDVYFFITF